MTEDIQFDAETGIVELRYEGELELSDLEASRATSESCRETYGSDLILVDARGVVKLPGDADMFAFGSTFLDASLPRLVRYAVVVSETSARQSQFLETVAQNRGILLRIFTDRTEAITWLSE